MSTMQLTQQAMALPLAQALWESIHAASGKEDLDETLYQDLKGTAEAQLSDFVTFDVESIIQQAKQRHAHGNVV